LIRVKVCHNLLTPVDSDSGKCRGGFHPKYFFYAKFARQDYDVQYYYTTDL
jgi:hypothetical protein